MHLILTIYSWKYIEVQNFFLRLTLSSIFSALDLLGSITLKSGLNNHNNPVRERRRSSVLEYIIIHFIRFRYTSPEATYFYLQQQRYLYLYKYIQGSRFELIRIQKWWQMHGLERKSFLHQLLGSHGGHTLECS